MRWQTKVVINDDFGGFSFTKTMVDMLKARGCKWADKIESVGGAHRDYYLPYEAGNTLRADEDLVAVVEELTAQYEKAVDSDTVMSWRERTDLRRKTLNDLKVVEVTVEIEIEDYDGKESIRVTGGAW